MLKGLAWKMFGFFSKKLYPDIILSIIILQTYAEYYFNQRRISQQAGQPAA